ncbi:MAG TPA: hypothetical protein VES20_15835 [Bryobacteraceae bacterium]|nr:hypothetical protein [Bryobacteraceae bacterium]
MSMSVPLLPPPYDQLEHRPFSFYPAIVGVEHNEWRLRRADWSELLVANTKTGQEIWIPRRYVGELSKIEEPVVIVGLTREVEYRVGQIVPHVRRVIEMPRGPGQTPRTETEQPAAAATAPPVGIRFESGTERRLGRLILGALAAGVLACVLLIVVFRSDREGRVSYAPVMQSELGLTSADDYHAVRRKLGDPSSDRWREGAGEMQIRALGYPGRDLTVILMGAEKDKALYIGSMDGKWRPVDAVNLPNGRDTYPLLRSLRRF